MLLKNRYRIEGLIGKGGMGRVYSAIDTLNGTRVAIKQIAELDEQRMLPMIERFRRECYFLLQINHPNIVKVHDFFQQQQNRLLTKASQWFLVMEFVEGILLSRLIVDYPKSLSLQDQLGIACQICKGVEVLNTASIVHRDIKPNNIMVDKSSGKVKILDLGIGKSTKGELATLTLEGGRIGTPAYMSPEQIDGEVQLNSDVFSVAIVLYQFFMWLKTSPFHDTNHLLIFNRIITQQIPPLLNFVNDPEYLWEYTKISEILERAMEKNYAKRTQTIKEVGNGLRNVYLSMESRLAVSEPKEETLFLSPIAKGVEWNLNAEEIKSLTKISQLPFPSSIQQTSSEEQKINKDLNKQTRRNTIKVKRKQATRRKKTKSFHKSQFQHTTDSDSPTKNSWNIISVTVVICCILILMGIYYDNHLEEARFLQAIRDCDYAVKINPDSAYVYKTRAAIRIFYNRDFHIALEDLNKAIILSPRWEILYKERGLLYEKMGRWQQAAQDLQTYENMRK